MLPIKTKRLIIRDWEEEDRESLINLNTDHRVMAYFPSVHTRDEAIQQFERFRQQGQRQGLTFWPVLDRSESFLGICGLLQIGHEHSFSPGVEIGWRFHVSSWGRGYAAEAANAVLALAFKTLNLKEVVSFTAEENENSWRLMERLKMTYDRSFQHPALSLDHRLSLHRLYKIQSDHF